MNFEYGCQITNRYTLFIDREDDGNDIIAEISTEKSSKTLAKDQQSQKNQSKSNNKNTVSKIKENKDSKKPLQQQTDNSVKSAKSVDAKNISKQQQQSNISKQNQNRAQTPREDKENNDNKPRQGNQQGNREFRKPRSDGGFQNDAQRRDNPEGARPPRRNNRPPRKVFSNEGGENQEGGNDQPTGNNATLNENGQNSGVGFRRGSGRGGFRTGRNGFGRRRPQAEREFDRHSGSDKTGVNPIDKKDGAGKGNWGTHKDELLVEEQIEEKQLETAEEDKNWANESEQKENEENKEVVPKYMTLDEYKALKNEIQKKNQTAFNIRQAGEGEAPNKWNNLTVLKKKEEDEEDEEIEEEEEEEEEGEQEEDVEQDEDEKKKLVNQIKIQFYEPTNKFSRGGGTGNTNRGRDNRRSNRGSKTPNQDKKAVPRIEDEKDFPSLGKN